LRRFASTGRWRRDAESITWTERKAAENNQGARKWKVFYRRLEIRGDGEAENPTAEESAAIPGDSHEQWDDVAKKLNGLPHGHFGRCRLQSVLDQALYVLESARHNLRIERERPQWRAFVAVEIYQFYTALEEAIRSAREIEQTTGFSGEALYAEAGE
jgi:hypothetical protein